MRFALVLALGLSACGGDPMPPLASGGSVGSGGASSGGASSGGASSGGAGTGGEHVFTNSECNQPESLPRTYSAVRQCVFEAGCSSSICHGGEVPLLLIDTWENFPRREDHSIYDKLTDTLLNHRVAHCASSPLVDPGHPENSAIIKALSRTCDDPEWGMPDGCSTTPCVPQPYIDFIAGWISQGAVM
jgi:hypothetical protein